MTGLRDRREPMELLVRDLPRAAGLSGACDPLGLRRDRERFVLRSGDRLVIDRRLTDLVGDLPRAGEDSCRGAGDGDAIAGFTVRDRQIEL